MITTDGRIVHCLNDRYYSPYGEVEVQSISRRALPLEYIWFCVSRTRAWAIVLACMPMLKNIARGNDDVLHDVMIPRALRIIELYKWWEEASIEWYLYKNLKWYAYKYERRRKREKNVELPEHTYETPDQDVRIQVTELLDSLPEFQAALLEWKYIDGYTIEEIGDHLGRCNTSVNGYLKDARAAARALSPEWDTA